MVSYAVTSDDLQLMMMVILAHSARPSRVPSDLSDLPMMSLRAMAMGTWERPLKVMAVGERAAPGARCVSAWWGSWAS